MLQVRYKVEMQDGESLRCLLCEQAGGLKGRVMSIVIPVVRACLPAYTWIVATTMY